MRPHYSQSSRENATPSNGTSPLASYKGVPSPGFYPSKKKTLSCNILPDSIATRMPYLRAKDELVSLERLSSRGHAQV